MSKEEFLLELRRELSGLNEVDKVDVLNFYSNYISEEISKGKSESAVIEELGSPRLLAKSILETKGNSKHTTSASGYYEETTSDNSSKVHTIDLDKWYVKVGVAFVVILIIAIILALVIGVFAIVIKIAIPLIVIMIVVALVESLFQR